MRYDRNRIYLSPAEQQRLASCRLLIAGCGIGSVIAECALRLGFEQLTLIDGDVVELANLNRQNYLQSDIGSLKTQSLRRRLEGINPGAVIRTHDIYLTEDNMEPYLNGHDIAVNALDFQSPAPFCFDTLCRQKKMPILHPYNFGWAALLFVVLPVGPGMEIISDRYEGFEKKLVSFFLESLPEESAARHWLGEVLARYEAEAIRQSPPQLSVGCWLLGGLCADIMATLALNGTIRNFPRTYFLTAR